MVKVVKEQNRPNIRIYFQLEEEQLYIQIDNAGREYVKNLKCVPEPDFQVKHRKFSDVEIMELPILFGGEMLKAPLGNDKDFRESLYKAITLEESGKINEHTTHQELEKLMERAKKRRGKEPIITCTYTEASGKSQKIEIPLMFHLARARIERRFHFS